MFNTREEWLLAGAEALRARFGASAVTVPPVRVAVSLPSGGMRSNTIGQCWYAGVAVEDDITQIFVSPKLAQPVEVLSVLLHELVHAALPVGTQHGPAFKKLGAAVGLTGKPKHMGVEPGDPAHAELTALAAELGPYPHAAIKAGAEKKQTTRQRLMVCPGCDSKLRGSKLVIEAGPPFCGNDDAHGGEPGPRMEPQDAADMTWRWNRG